MHALRAFLVRVARGEGLTPEDAFDAVQEAFSAFLLLPHPPALVESEDEARQLLIALTRNVARNFRRLHAVTRPHLSEQDALEALEDGAPPADQRLAQAEEQGRLAGCVGQLEDIQRAVVTLRMLDELPGQDVARLLGLKPGHVAVLLHRAKASLYTCMTDDPPLSTFMEMQKP